ncbi:DISARM system SNF2-like helicase DrmD [Ktedonobacter racemifer]|uniref:Helicase domain protein n=1 Tax=Ktedonobacter racemifer DSM 44963 TaxID=485913 RepID=D6U8L7_KTERA|nr:DISARM system SNF2-like helicase DrmD [Ktedonobacter racemifer]EFH80228.1 helicase domain protein [Ktedonobacter racemifer DSM 44963]
MGSTFALPEPGQLVAVRHRRYVVVDVAQNTLPLDILAKNSLTSRQHLVTLSSVEDDALGEELQVIWEVEPGAQPFDGAALPEPTGFDAPERLDTFLNAVRWGAASSADVQAIQAPFRSGIQLEDYQLDPVARAIEMPRVNLLIADDVGLGKTIEAGLVIQELIIRHRARRVLIVCPASLQVQWRDQMRDKFGLEFRIVDSKLVSELRRERGPNVNPWSHFPRLITSIDYLKRERPLRLFSETLPREGESLYPRKYDLLIVDEAHNVAPSGRGKYATDSQKTQALRRIAPHFEHKLFLSATPHNGYRESFSALLELLDNQRFARGVNPNQKQLETIMVRRLKSEMKDWDGSARFPERKIADIRVSYTQQEREIHRALREYSRHREKQAREKGDNTSLYAVDFVTTLLKKRLFSSPAAFLSTLEKHIESLTTPKRHATVTRRPSVGILRSKLEQIEQEHDDEEELYDATAEALEATAPLFEAPNAQDLAQLEQMRAWAEQASQRSDSKAQELVKWLQEHIKPGGKWSRERVIIFTEYRDTQKWLFELLTREGFTEKGPDGESRTLLLYGGMDTKDREEVKAAFQADPDDASVRILLATDAASEGIDLQNHCSRLIHYEIPWNPNRLEQRNGRVDRHGQRAPQVDIYHFVSSTYQQAQSWLEPDQLDADLSFLWTAVKKINQIREDLGSVGPVIASQVEEAMLGRRKELDTRQAEVNTPSKRLQSFRQRKREEMQQRIHELHQQLLDGKRELHMEPRNIQSVVEIALQLAKQPPLQKRQLVDPHGKRPTIEVYDVPELSGSWARCTEGLEHPHTHQKRPIVFDHALAYGRDDVVLAHLNHRLVTMALRLLRAEIWSGGTQGSLHRVTARTLAPNISNTPIVVAYARLLILGSDSQRLHEELIITGGRIHEGNFEALGEEELSRVLASVQSNPAPENQQRKIQNSWLNLRAPVTQALEQQMRVRTRELRKKLAQRANKEQRDITAILKELQKSILDELRQPEEGPQQLTLFSSEERQQYDHDLRTLEARAQQIDEEIEEEVKRIQQRYADPQPRLFPVALMFLFPPTGW